MSKPPLERITITIPQPVLAAADELAARLDRSRSWVLAEAVRRMVGAASGGTAPSAPIPPAKPASPTPQAQLRQRLSRALALTPLARLQAAEEAARVAPTGRQQRPRREIIAFDSLAEYQQWRTRPEAEG